MALYDRFSRSVNSDESVQQASDLHLLQMPTDGEPRSLVDYSLTVRGADVEVMFHDLEARLIRLIDTADVVVGCVAWLTNRRILAALAERRGVSIVVQKEDFLRPDVEERVGWRQQLRRAYDRLPEMSRYSFRGLIGSLSYCNDPTLAPVRCVGNHNSANTTGPRAHHKFVVFCRWHGSVDDTYGGEIEPYAVWTGSFNFTETANRSFENAVFIQDQDVAAAFLNEYSQIVALSEPLDWESNWVQPEWRIGS